MKPIQAFLVLCLGVTAGSTTAIGQGTIYFNNLVQNVVVAPVYGLDNPGNPFIHKTGNTPEGFPAEGQWYNGAKLAGTGYTAELWGGPEGSPRHELVPLARTTFRTGAAAGYIQPLGAVVVAGVPAGARAALELRVWDNQGGTLTNWAQIPCSYGPFGYSDLFVSDPLGGPLVVTWMRGLRSFCLFRTLSSDLDYSILGSRGDSHAGSYWTVACFESEDLRLYHRCVNIPGASLQWRRAGVNLPNETNSALNLPRIQLDQAGDYSLVATFTTNWSQSYGIAVVVTPPPRFTTNLYVNSTGSLYSMLDGATNRNMVFELSEDFGPWVPWTTQHLAGPQWIILPGPLAPTSRFIRARALP